MVILNGLEYSGDIPLLGECNLPFRISKLARGRAKLKVDDAIAFKVTEDALGRIPEAGHLIAQIIYVVREQWKLLFPNGGSFLA